MQDNKYYTPSFNDFFVGIEFEALNSNEWFFSESETGWKQLTWEPRLMQQGAREIAGAIERGWIRIKELSKEDIKAEGFDKVGDHIYENERFIIVYTSPILSITDKKRECDRVNRLVCKNKSELRRILKMIGV